MKRGALVLLLVVASALMGAVVAWVVQYKPSPLAWLESEFGLNAEQMKQATALHDDYEKTCGEICAKIEVTDTILAEAIRTHRTITPEIATAIAETDKVRTECRIRMLAHFYQTAALIPEDRRARYLETVLPLVLHPGEMHADHDK